jgi:hypothetical protein
MKKIICFLFCIALLQTMLAQETVNLNDFGRIALNTYVSEQSNLPNEAKSQLEIKLKQIASNYGMAGSTANPRFVITAHVSVSTKDIIPGPPQQIAQKLDITFFIGDAIENKVFASLVTSSKGVGINENKSFIDAIKQVNTKNKNVESFLEEGKNKIVSYYSTQCEFIIKRAESLKQQEKFNEAIYILSQVPDVCKDCYIKCLKEMALIYDLKINTEANNLLSSAKAVWSANPNNEGGQKAVSLIMQINPISKCYSAASNLMKTINGKIISDEKELKRMEEETAKREHELSLENIKQEAELDKLRINAYREIAVEYAKNQPKTITYNNIYWR